MDIEFTVESSVAEEVFLSLRDVVGISVVLFDEPEDECDASFPVGVFPPFRFPPPRKFLKLFVGSEIERVLVGEQWQQSFYVHALEVAVEVLPACSVILIDDAVPDAVELVDVLEEAFEEHLPVERFRVQFRGLDRFERIVHVGFAEVFLIVDVLVDEPSEKGQAGFSVVGPPVSRGPPIRLMRILVGAERFGVFPGEHGEEFFQVEQPVFVDFRESREFVECHVDGFAQSFALSMFGERVDEECGFSDGPACRNQVLCRLRLFSLFLFE